jgi:hypothetical protein
VSINTLLCVVPAQPRRGARRARPKPCDRYPLLTRKKTAVESAPCPSIGTNLLDGANLRTCDPAILRSCDPAILRSCGSFFS